jgi:polysaccharide biosynthesis protein PslH
MRILAISSWWPFPADNGARMRIASLLETLAESHEVHLVALSQEPIDHKQIEMAQQYCASVAEARQRLWVPRRFEQFSSLWSSAPTSVRATYNPLFASLVQQRVQEIHPDVVVVFALAAAPYAAQVVGIPKILEELEITNILDQYLLAKPPQRLRSWLTWVKHRSYVQQTLASFDACSVVSEREQHFARQLVSPSMPVEVIPNGASFKPIACQPEVRPDTLIYPGALSYSANLDAMRYFLADIFPQIRAQRPAAQLQITGKVTEAQRLALPSLEGVDLTGYVADIRTAIADTYCEVVPLREGGGTRLKILEALALGTPVISTRKGAEGLDLADGQDYLLADTPSEFAQTTLELLNNPLLRAKLSAHGQQTVFRKYDWRMIGARLTALITQVTQERFDEQRVA